MSEQRGASRRAAFSALVSPASRATALLLACWMLVESAACPVAVAETFPYRQEPVNYFSDELADPVSKLRSEIDMGTVRLEFEKEGGRGYLRSLLKALDVSPASQMLVFAKNSVNARTISPENPRALYFNDAAYIGFVPGAPFLEISAVDPRKGAVFYTLAQKDDATPSLVREESCLLCHVSVNSLHVPGHLVRSFVTDPQGNPGRGYSRVTHDSPYANRWGGYFVTGDFGSLPHLGNLSTAADLLEHERHRDGPGRPVDLARRLDAAKYLSSHSDVVALLVHEHQTHGHNLLTRVNYEHQFQKPENSEEELLRYLLFADEPPLEDPVLGSSAYESGFVKLGPRDGQGRTLRQFDLETRLFKYRLSYLIYSDSFDLLPDPVRLRLYRRLWEILSAERPAAPFDRLPRAERTAVLEIVRDTKRGLPEYWKP
ncbi:MAG: hypothetical protein HY290_09680 [Planctomycetia bacterium]|nr:hypothetical protein [Planctomycetia bacterium]